jgi:tRNA 2-thiocytidine biosynthesis protein TtcA
MHPKRLESRILSAMHRANREFDLIEPGDSVLVALSGGKDSYALLWGLMKMSAAAPFELPLVAYHLDQGQPGHDPSPLEAFLRTTGVPYEIEVQDTYSAVIELTEPGKVYCSVCSRFRRAILYKAAHRLGCYKVALGHHSDDLIETLLLSMLYSGQIKSMPPRLRSERGPEEIIRPLCYVPEAELAELATVHEFPIIPCNLCGTQNTQRQFVKGLLADLSERSGHVRGNLLNSLANVRTTHLMDKRLNPLFAGGGRDDASPEPADPVGERWPDDDDDLTCGPPPPEGNSRLPVL